MVLKFLHIQSHFIHLYFLTIFEVIFYIYYIMPYEKSIFKHLFDNDLDMIPKLNNITTYMEVNNCDKYERKLNKDNDELWNNCFLYIIIMSSLFFIMMVRDIWKNYTNYIIITITTVPRYDSKSAIVSFGSFQNLGDYKKNDDNESSVEMVTSPKNTTLTDTNGVIENPTFIKYYWYNSGFLAEFIKTIEFIILVGIFEYLFFAYIVNKYKIANSKTILCNIYKKIK
jgi:hypothetical protein